MTVRTSPFYGNWAIWRRFKTAGIEIPFPQRVVHLAPPRVNPE
jgi:small-conductance mechanosensitive channel